MLIMNYASLATISELFSFKEQGFKLDDFPGYTPDQWGIKAHNRPWIEEAGQFKQGQKIIEVGGAYSQFPRYLSEKYNLEAWIGDDFGKSTDDPMWSRWGRPEELPIKYPAIRYVFEPFGKYSEKYPEQYFDYIFSISTLEHIPKECRIDVLKDMNRCLKPGGKQLHTIDISIPSLRYNLLHAVTDSFPFIRNIHENLCSEIHYWIKAFEESGVKIEISIPNSISLLNRAVLVESPDVVYRFYPPNNAPKLYQPNASLLIIIEN